MAPEFGWWPMSPWLSPGAAWFIFFNVLVAAIAVMSSPRGPEPAARRRLVRTASTVVLESLRSISNFPFHSLGDYGVACSAPAASQLHHVQHQYNSTFQEQEAREVSRMEPEPASVAEEETVVAAATTTPPQSAPVAAPAAQEVNRMEPEPASVAQEETVMAATTTTSPQSAPVAALDASATASKGEVEDGESISLDEAYALARAGRHSAADTAATVPKKVKGRGAYGCGRGTEDVEGKAEVDARAEQFIRQFREELKLERINSILNYTHALRRTAGAR